jgi:diguanylate cyclase (GGDEF)-like protein
MLRKKPVEVEETGPQYAIDAATGVPDRSNLEGWLEAASRVARAESSRVALSFLELENFSEVSDTYGPEVADQVLATVGQRLTNVLEGGQQLCRYYGAEFAVITPGVNSVERATELTEWLLAIVSEPVAIGDGQVTTKTAAGVALSDSGYESNAAWVHDAHDALTEARPAGHQACVAHDEATRNRVDVRITHQRVLKGFTHNEFYLMYQPIVASADNRIVGLEALLRWRDPGASGTFIEPAHFMDLLEHLGLTVPVGSWALTEATTQVQRWNTHHQGRQPLFVSVNLSPRQLAHRDFVSSVMAALDTSQLDPRLLSLDLTDDALRFNKGAAWNPLRELKFRGVRIGLDDFGMGEVGMVYLRDLQVDSITIHRRFLEGLGQVAEDAAIVRAIVALGRELGITTVAEGVETTEQERILKEIGPDLLQGYYYGRAELPEHIDEILAKGPTLEGSEDWRMSYSALHPPSGEPVPGEAPPPAPAS